MGLIAALTAHQTTRRRLGVVTVPPPGRFRRVEDAARGWSGMLDALSEAALGIQSSGGAVLCQRGNRLFFESDAEVDGAEYFSGPEELQAGIEDAPEDGIEVADEGSGEMEGYEITPEDWAHVEALSKGDQPEMDRETGEWLSEIGLVARAGEGWALTRFGKDWIGGKGEE